MRDLASGVRTFLLVLVPALVFSSPALSQDNPLMGAWIVTEWESADGEVDSQPEPGLFLFTLNHYSIMHVNTDEPRPIIPRGEGTDAQWVAIYNPFTANSGRYEVSGDQVITHSYVAKNPGVMDGFPNNGGPISFQVSDAGDVLHLTYGNGNKATLRQVDGSDPPG